MQEVKYFFSRFWFGLITLINRAVDTFGRGPLPFDIRKTWALVRKTWALNSLILKEIAILSTA